MLKRATWLGVGFGLGVGTSVVAARKAKRQLQRYRPDAVFERTTQRVEDELAAFRSRLSAAVEDGRDAARERAAVLRARAPVRPTDRNDGEHQNGSALPS